ncbi:MAG: DUF4292 domain-containing protein [Muribaculaceae bacterium]|nr:DUF4292 domain-containing protein [Muribaculaceae bacterium]
MKYNYLIYATIAATVMLSSCHSRKKAVAADTYVPGMTAPVDNSAVASQTGADTYAAWTSVQMPVKVKVTAPKNISLSGTLKMVAGESVSMSLRYLGLMEVGTLYADKDSVLIVSKMLDLYFSESVAELQKRSGMSFADMQDILLGRKALPDRFSGSGSPISITFAAPKDTEVGPVSPSVDVEAKVKNKTMALTISNTLDRAAWNGPMTITRPAIGRGMTRVTLDKVLALLSSL